MIMFVAVAVIIVLLLIICLYQKRKSKNDTDEGFYILQIEGKYNSFYQNKITPYALNYFGIKSILNMNESTFKTKFNNEPTKSIKLIHYVENYGQIKKKESYSFMRGKDGFTK